MDFSSLNADWIDLVILIVFFFYLLGGYGRGFLLGTVDLFGFIFSFVSAVKFYQPVGDFFIDNFSITRGIARALGFFIAGILSEFFYSLFTNFVIKNIYSKMRVSTNNKRVIVLLKKLDNFFGIFPAAGETEIFIAFVLTLLVSLPLSGKLKNSIVSSRIGGPIVKKTQGLERQLNTIFGDAVNETLTFLTVNPNPGSQESVDLGFTQKEAVVDSQAEITMLTLINIERQNNDLPILHSDGKLKQLARNYAREMFAGGFFSHYNPEGQSPFDRMEEENISFLAAGENLALAPNVTIAHQGLMNSPGHRANILSPDFGRVGIGVIDGGIYGSLFVQEFID